MTLADKYIEAVNAADIERLLALFADDAVVRNPSGVFDGKEAIRGFYESVVLAGQALITIERHATVGDIEVLQIAATSHLAEVGSEPMYAADIFVIDGDQIATLDIYYR